MKYYFGWNAPLGAYFSLYGKYSSYQESFKDLADENNNYNKNINVFGRGVGIGYQCRIKELVILDLVAGYIVQDKKSEQQGFGEDDFTQMIDEKKDGLRIAVSLGTSF